MRHTWFTYYIKLNFRNISRKSPKIKKKKFRLSFGLLTINSNTNYRIHLHTPNYPTFDSLKKVSQDSKTVNLLRNKNSARYLRLFPELLTNFSVLNTVQNKIGNQNTTLVVN